MNPEVGKIVQQLADKLGVTAQYLWGVLVRGNRVEGGICTLFVVIGIVAAYAGYRLFKSGYARDGEGAVVAGAILSIAGIATSIGCLYWAIMDTFCPEYGALADLLSHLGK